MLTPEQLLYMTEVLGIESVLVPPSEAPIQRATSVDVIFWNPSEPTQAGHEMISRIAVAMKLKFEQYEIAHGETGIESAIAQYQCRALIAFDGTHAEPTQVGSCWVLKTHGLDKLLSDSSLKKITWQGLQVLSKKVGL
jgi:hypothetical protein